jgi:hypothetical protein
MYSSREQPYVNPGFVPTGTVALTACACTLLPLNPTGTSANTMEKIKEREHFAERKKAKTGRSILTPLDDTNSHFHTSMTAGST